MDAVAARNIRPHLRVLSDADAARSSRPIERFMACKAQGRDDAVRQVDRIGPGRLGRIDDEHQGMLAAEGLDAFQVHDVARHVRCMVAHDGLRRRPQLLFQFIVPQGPHAGFRADKIDGRSLLLQLIQGPQDGVVFPRRRQDVVARPEQPFQHHVESRRGIMRKGHVVCLAGMKQRLNQFLRLQHYPVGLQRIGVGAPGRIAQQAAAEGVVHGLSHGLRLLRRRRGVVKVIHVHRSFPLNS